MTNDTIIFWKGVIILSVVTSVPIIIACLAFLRRYPHTYEYQGELPTGIFHKKDDAYIEVMSKRYICSNCKKKYDTLGDIGYVNDTQFKDCKGSKLK